ncbi:hypothetical protein KL905_003073 [Ogataea polymorpha]|uniref:Major facilitator superfamily (MFS) profile domain-containing protein n=1 Tax=Ogataea polymorpha TaxID=460523 RepID=A0A9P8TFX6_9ASCO|nr:hypothetical protein KL937_003293 [Ogataea polymorpha]KAG7888225.1 hypothetical protein KL936_003437 [Ogataea polymorpha]KAG7902756.1 hypothetical protein KL907_003889 [Ogataea polymorpha]KAG7920439.1 hypothetical protein KL905_003073 [Ogataea polymorpha]KAG7935139.1 hypothetical protein KL904_003471 [Ogataea polymorpha]
MFFKTKDKEDPQAAISEEEFDHLMQVARAQQKVEHDLTRWQATKAYPWTVYFMFVCVWSMVLVGYENQAGGMVVSIPEFRKDFGFAYEGDYVLEAKWQSAITGAPTGALAVGLMLGSFFADRVGRRNTLFCAVLLTVPFITLEYIATSIEVFFVGKFFNSFCLGMISSCCSVYVSECAPLALRGFFAATIALALCIGPFICVLINNTTSTYTTRMAYRGIFIPQWIFSITAMAMIMTIPESAYWFLSKGKRQQALKSLTKMYRKESVIQKQYAMMYVTVMEASEISAKAGTYLDCFKAKDLRRTLLVIFALFMQAMSGVSYVSNYSTYYYQYAGYDTQKSFQISCGAQALSISGVISSWFIIDRFGRRPLMIGGMIAITILNLLIASTGIDKSNIPAMKTSSGFMAMYNYVYNIALGAVPYILAAEVSSVFLRAKTYALANLTNNALQCMWQFVLPYMFNANEANMGSKINFIFTGCSFLSIFVFYFYLPETAGRSFEEIDEMFALKIPARQWKHWQTKKQEESDRYLKELKIVESHDEDPKTIV